MAKNRMNTNKDIDLERVNIKAIIKPKREFKKPDNNDFWQQYKDPRWQKKRLKIMERDEFMCINCGTENKTLNVHHLEYVKNRLPWEYDDDNLITLCEDCHKEITDILSTVIGDIKRLIRRGECFYYVVGIFDKIKNLYPPELDQIDDIIKAFTKYNK